MTWVPPDLARCDTLPRLLRHNGTANAGAVAMREKEFGIWRALAWGDVLARTRAMTLGLEALGVGSNWD